MQQLTTTINGKRYTVEKREGKNYAVSNHGFINLVKASSKIEAVAIEAARKDSKLRMLSNALGFDTLSDDEIESIGALFEITTDAVEDLHVAASGRDVFSDFGKEAAILHYSELEDDQIEIYDIGDPSVAVQIGHFYLVAI